MADETVTNDDAGNTNSAENSVVTDKAAEPKTASEPVAPDTEAKADSSPEASLSAGTSSAAMASADPEQPMRKRRGRPPKSATMAALSGETGGMSAKKAPKLAKAAAGSASFKSTKPKPVKPAKPVKAPGSPTLTASQATPVPKAAAKTVAAIKNVAEQISATQPLRKEPMTMDMSANFSTFQNSMADAQAKAKEAFEKTTGMFGEASEFAKGNVEAMIESGKIFSEGLQEMGSTMAAETKAAFESMSADMKQLTTVKSPTDFINLQSELMRKNFDSAVAYGSKNSEAMLKLMSDTMAPLSGRVSMAVEKARQSAI